MPIALVSCSIMNVAISSPSYLPSIFSFPLQQPSTIQCGVFLPERVELFNAQPTDVAHHWFNLVFIPRIISRTTFNNSEYILISSPYNNLRIVFLLARCHPPCLPASFYLPRQTRSYHVNHPDLFAENKINGRPSNAFWLTTNRWTRITSPLSINLTNGPINLMITVQFDWSHNRKWEHPEDSTDESFLIVSYSPSLRSSISSTTP